jgi:hypothetical protein
MTKVVNRHPANVHPDMARLKWQKVLHRTGQRVENSQTHGMKSLALKTVLRSATKDETRHRLQ